MTKKLSMKVIKEDNKKYKEFIELPLDSQGEEYVIKIYPYFSPTKTTKLLSELTDFYRNTKQENVSVQEEEFDDILGYFVVRHFTDISMSKSKKAKTLYEEFNLLKDSLLFELILKSIPEESLEYLYERVHSLVEFSSKLESKLQQINGLKLENPEVLRSNKEVQ